MKPYFENPEHRDALKVAVEQWDGTPFRHRARVKRGGVDCINLVIALYEEAGMKLSIELPDYGLFDGACRTNDGPIIDWLNANSEQFIQMEYGPPCFGDLLCFNIYQSVHHVGVMLDGALFIHSIRDRGTYIAPFHDPTFKERLASVHRPIEQVWEGHWL